MNRICKAMLCLAGSMMFLAASATSTFAMGNGTGEIDYEGGVVRAQGMGIAPAKAVNMAQARIMARRAAVVDGWRQLAETVKGVDIDSETTLEMNMVQSDIVRSKMSASIKGARVVEEHMEPDGAYVVTMEVPMFGVSGSVAAAAMPRPEVKESFPQPVADVAPAAPVTQSVHVDVTVNTQTSAPAAPVNGKAAAAAPSGKAIGGFTGLIVDCRGLGLKPVMSPVIKNANGQPIYGYKNLDYDGVIANGMAGYTSDMSRGVSRAGSHPLLVKAVSLDNHNGNPVLSVADANRVLIENGATGFLDKTNVVFVR